MGKDILSKIGLKNFLMLDLNRDIREQDNTHWLKFCLNEEQLQRNESIAIDDVVYIVRDFKNNVQRYTKTYSQHMAQFK